MSKNKIKDKKEKKSKGGLKKIFNQSTFLGITLAGMLVLVVIYVFVYMRSEERRVGKECRGLL